MKQSIPFVRAIKTKVCVMTKIMRITWTNIVLKHVVIAMVGKKYEYRLR